jgi:hypothetical protein
VTAIDTGNPPVDEAAFLADMRQLAAHGNTESARALRAGVRSYDDLDAWQKLHGDDVQEERHAEDAAAIAGGAFELWWYGQQPHPNVRYPVNVARLMRDGCRRWRWC